MNISLLKFQLPPSRNTDWSLIAFQQKICQLISVNSIEFNQSSNVSANDCQSKCKNDCLDSIRQISINSTSQLSNESSFLSARTILGGASQRIACIVGNEVFLHHSKVFSRLRRNDIHVRVNFNAIWWRRTSCSLTL